MTMKRSIITWGFIILLIGACLSGFVTPTNAETMKYKVYTYSAKTERVLIGDVEGHALALGVRRGMLAFENGENGTEISVFINDTINMSGPLTQYTTTTFADGSTIVTKVQGTTTGTAVGTPTIGETTGEIIKGTGRFAGIKGTHNRSVKYLRPEKGEDASKGIGEGIITYTLPSK